MASELQHESKGGYLKAEIAITNPSQVQSLELTMVNDEGMPHVNIIFISEFERKPKANLRGKITVLDHTITLLRADSWKVTGENHKYLNQGITIFGDNAWNPVSGVFKLDKDGLRLTVVKAQEKQSSSNGIYISQVLKERLPGQLISAEMEKNAAKTVKKVWLKVTATYQDSTEPVVAYADQPIFHKVF